MVVTVVQMVLRGSSMRLMMVAADRCTTGHLLHVPLRRLGCLSVRNGVAALVVPAKMLPRTTGSLSDRSWVSRWLLRHCSYSRRVLFIFACSLVILVTFARAVRRIRRRLAALGLGCLLDVNAIRRILIGLLVPLFLLLRDLRYVGHDLVRLLLHLSR